MRDSYRSGTDGLAASGLADLVAEGTAPTEGWSVEPRLFQVPLATFADNLEKLTEEHFGPAAVVVTYTDPAELEPVLPRLPGTLTGTVHAAESEHEDAGRVADAAGGGSADLQRLADRCRRGLGHAPRRAVAGHHQPAAHVRRGHLDPAVGGTGDLPVLAGRPAARRAA
jgi:hypothetical protein